MTPEQRAAIVELQQKTLQQIQAETAYKWAYRAWAAYQLNLVHDVVEYRHEALEHAALCDDDRVLVSVRAIMEMA